MAGNSVQPRGTLSHFHACVYCGSLFRRDEFEGRPISSGIYPCFKCGQEGPLNIVIGEVDGLPDENNRQSSS